MKNLKKGFTLIEILIVIAIIVIMSTVVIVALNPTKRFQDARNSRRQSDVESILTAIHQSIVDNNGTMPAGISTTEQQLGTCVSGGATLCTGASAACLNLSASLSAYLKTMPIDPNGSAATTGYSVVADTNNLITVKSCSAEGGKSILISR